MSSNFKSIELSEKKRDQFQWFEIRTDLSRGQKNNVKNLNNIIKWNHVKVSKKC